MDDETEVYSLSYFDLESSSSNASKISPTYIGSHTNARPLQPHASHHRGNDDASIVETLDTTTHEHLDSATQTSARATTSASARPEGTASTVASEIPQEFQDAQFSMRVVEVDYEMEPPCPGLDPLRTNFRDVPLQKVPVIRLYGIHPSGVRATINVHGVFPYLFVEVQESKLQPFYRHALRKLSIRATIRLVRAAQRQGHDWEWVKSSLKEIAPKLREAADKFAIHKMGRMLADRLECALLIDQLVAVRNTSVMNGGPGSLSLVQVSELVKSATQAASMDNWDNKSTQSGLSQFSISQFSSMSQRSFSFGTFSASMTSTGSSNWSSSAFLRLRTALLEAIKRLSPEGKATATPPKGQSRGAASDRSPIQTFLSRIIERDFVHDVRVVHGRVFFGYRREAQRFFRLSLIDPGHVGIACRLFLGGAVTGEPLQPYEANVPYLISFLVDYNISGMDMVYISDAKLRTRPKATCKTKPPSRGIYTFQQQQAQHQQRPSHDTAGTYLPQDDLDLEHKTEASLFATWHSMTTDRLRQRWICSLFGCHGYCDAFPVGDDQPPSRSRFNPSSIKHYCGLSAGDIQALGRTSTKLDHYSTSVLKWQASPISRTFNASGDVLMDIIADKSILNKRTVISLPVPTPPTAANLGKITNSLRSSVPLDDSNFTSSLPADGTRLHLAGLLEPTEYGLNMFAPTAPSLSASSANSRLTNSLHRHPTGRNFHRAHKPTKFISTLQEISRMIALDLGISESQESLANHVELNQTPHRMVTVFDSDRSKLQQIYERLLASKCEKAIALCEARKEQPFQSEVDSDIIPLFNVVLEECLLTLDEAKVAFKRIFSNSVDTNDKDPPTEFTFAASVEEEVSRLDYETASVVSRAIVHEYETKCATRVIDLQVAVSQQLAEALSSPPSGRQRNRDDAQAFTQQTEGASIHDSHLEGSQNNVEREEGAESEDEDEESASDLDDQAECDDPDIEESELVRQIVGEDPSVNSDSIDDVLNESSRAQDSNETEFHPAAETEAKFVEERSLLTPSNKPSASPNVIPPDTEIHTQESEAKLTFRTLFSTPFFKRSRSLQPCETAELHSMDSRVTTGTLLTSPLDEQHEDKVSDPESICMRFNSDFDDENNIADVLDEIAQESHEDAHGDAIAEELLGKRNRAERSEQIAEGSASSAPQLDACFAVSQTSTQEDLEPSRKRTCFGLHAIDAILSSSLKDTQHNSDCTYCPPVGSNSCLTQESGSDNTKVSQRTNIEPERVTETEALEFTPNSPNFSTQSAKSLRRWPTSLRTAWQQALGGQTCADHVSEVSVLRHAVDEPVSVPPCRIRLLNPLPAPPLHILRIDPGREGVGRTAPPFYFDDPQHISQTAFNTPDLSNTQKDEHKARTSTTAETGANAVNSSSGNSVPIWPTDENTVIVATGANGKGASFWPSPSHAKIGQGRTLSRTWHGPKWDAYFMPAFRSWTLAHLDLEEFSLQSPWLDRSALTGPKWTTATTALQLQLRRDFVAHLVRNGIFSDLQPRDRLFLNYSRRSAEQPAIVEEQSKLTHLTRQYKRVLIPSTLPPRSHLLNRKAVPKQSAHSCSTKVAHGDNSPQATDLRKRVSGAVLTYLALEVVAWNRPTYLPDPNIDPIAAVICRVQRRRRERGSPSDDVIANLALVNVAPPPQGALDVANIDVFSYGSGLAIVDEERSGDDERETEPPCQCHACRTGISDGFGKRQEDFSNIETLSQAGRWALAAGITHRLGLCPKMLRKKSRAINTPVVRLCGSERDLYIALISMVRCIDPDVVLGFENVRLSWGYVKDRYKAVFPYAPPFELMISRLRVMPERQLGFSDPSLDTEVFERSESISPHLTEKYISLALEALSRLGRRQNWVADAGALAAEPGGGIATIEDVYVQLRAQRTKPSPWARYASRKGCELTVKGRLVVNAWRLMRHEARLQCYSAQTVALTVLGTKLPKFSASLLTTWMAHSLQGTPGRDRGLLRVLEYFVRHNAVTMEAIDKVGWELVTANLARVTGLRISDIMNRGSQIRVESVMLRLARPLQFVVPAFSRAQVESQPAMEASPLNLEPEAYSFYSSPVIVFDFRSLYPSVMMAYNICYSTFIGKLTEASSAPTTADASSNETKGRTASIDGKAGRRRAFADVESDHELDEEELLAGDRDDDSDAEGEGLRHEIRPSRPRTKAKFGSWPDIGAGAWRSEFTPLEAIQAGPGKIQLDWNIIHHLHEKKKIWIAPNGALFVTANERLGILPRLLAEILGARFELKRATSDPRLQANAEDEEAAKGRMLSYNALQLALKLIANVTYGYTGAGYSGRMPCAEIADAIVQTARDILERAIADVNRIHAWGARVVYGDTDSLFVLLEGKTLNEARKIGAEIARYVTESNPYPVHLEMEKVYYPCILVSKKRYAGWKYSPKAPSPSKLEQNEEGTFECKGLEATRRDSCPLVQTTMRNVLIELFRTRNISRVQNYITQVVHLIRANALPLSMYVFCKEVKMGSYRRTLPTAAAVAELRVRHDPRALPVFAERVPYVITDQVLMHDRDPKEASVSSMVRAQHRVRFGLQMQSEYVFRALTHHDNVFGMMQADDIKQATLLRAAHAAAAKFANGSVTARAAAPIEALIRGYRPWAEYYIFRQLVPALKRILDPLGPAHGSFSRQVFNNAFMLFDAHAPVWMTEFEHTLRPDSNNQFMDYRTNVLMNQPHLALELTATRPAADMERWAVVAYASSSNPNYETHPGWGSNPLTSAARLDGSSESNRPLDFSIENYGAIIDYHFRTEVMQGHLLLNLPEAVTDRDVNSPFSPMEFAFLNNHKTDESDVQVMSDRATRIRATGRQPFNRGSQQLPNDIRTFLATILCIGCGRILDPSSRTASCGEPTTHRSKLCPTCLRDAAPVLSIAYEKTQRSERYLRSLISLCMSCGGGPIERVTSGRSFLENHRMRDQLVKVATIACVGSSSDSGSDTCANGTSAMSANTGSLDTTNESVHSVAEVAMVEPVNSGVQRVFQETPIEDAIACISSDCPISFRRALAREAVSLAASRLKALETEYEHHAMQQ